MRGTASLEALLGAVVRVGTVRVGEVAGVFLDGRRERVLGLEVSSAGGARRFVPWVTVELAGGEVRIGSALVFVDEAGSYERLGAVVVRRRELLAGLLGSENGDVSAVRRVSPGAAEGTLVG